MPAAIILLVYGLAVARVTRLVVADVLTKPLRERIIDWSYMRAFPHFRDYTVAERRMYRGERDVPALAYLITCPWCSSIYIGLLAAPVIYFWGESPWLLVPALALALSHFTGVLAEIAE